MAAKRALITGITGQDGSYLAEFLLEKGYEVHGMVRRSSTETFQRLAGFRDDVVLHTGDLLDQRSLVDVLRESEPDEIYNLAAMGHPAGLNEDFNISADRELTVAEIARICWEACGNDPADLEFEHLPSFKVDVQRRWPSVEKAERLLGWRARIDVEEGIAQTVAWLRRHADMAA